MNVNAVSIRRIVLEIRHLGMLLTTEEQWWQQQPPGDTRAEAFRRIRFWREVYADAMQRLGRTDQVGEPRVTGGK